MNSKYHAKLSHISKSKGKKKASDWSRVYQFNFIVIWWVFKCAKYNDIVIAYGALCKLILKFLVSWNSLVHSSVNCWDIENLLEFLSF